MADFRAVEADAIDAAQIGQRLVERRFGIGFVEVAEEAHDQFRRHAKTGLCIVERAGDAGDDDFEGDTARGMPLGVEEDFDVAHRVGMGAGEVGGGEVVKVLLGVENTHPLIINVEEILKVREGVGGAHFFDIGEGNSDAVALRQLEHQFGFERTFDMEVELGLGQCGDERGAVGGRGETIMHQDCLLRAG